MRKAYRVISTIVLAAFLLNTVASDLAFGQPLNASAASDKLAIASGFDDILGIAPQERNIVARWLTAYLTLMRNQGVSITPENFKRLSEYKGKPVSYTGKTQYFVHEVTPGPEGFVQVMVRTTNKGMNEFSRGTHTWYALCPTQPDKDGGFPVMVSDKKPEAVVRNTDYTRASTSGSAKPFRVIFDMNAERKIASLGIKKYPVVKKLVSIIVQAFRDENSGKGMDARRAKKIEVDFLEALKKAEPRDLIRADAVVVLEGIFGSLTGPKGSIAEGLIGMLNTAASRADYTKARLEASSPDEERFRAVFESGARTKFNNLIKLNQPITAALVHFIIDAFLDESSPQGVDRDRVIRDFTQMLIDQKVEVNDAIMAIVTLQDIFDTRAGLKGNSIAWELIERLNEGTRGKPVSRGERKSASGQAMPADDIFGGLIRFFRINVDELLKGKSIDILRLPDTQKDKVFSLSFTTKLQPDEVRTPIKYNYEIMLTEGALEFKSVFLRTGYSTKAGEPFITSTIRFGAGAVSVEDNSGAEPIKYKYTCDTSINPLLYLAWDTTHRKICAVVTNEFFDDYDRELTRMQAEGKAVKGSHSMPVFLPIEKMIPLIDARERSDLKIMRPTSNINISAIARASASGKPSADRSASGKEELLLRAAGSVSQSAASPHDDSRKSASGLQSLKVYVNNIAEREKITDVTRVRLYRRVEDGKLVRRLEIVGKKQQGANVRKGAFPFTGDDVNKLLDGFKGLLNDDSLWKLSLNTEALRPSYVDSMRNLLDGLPDMLGSLRWEGGVSHEFDNVTAEGVVWDGAGKVRGILVDVPSVFDAGRASASGQSAEIESPNGKRITELGEKLAGKQGELDNVRRALSIERTTASPKQGRVSELMIRVSAIEEEVASLETTLRNIKTWPEEALRRASASGKEESLLRQARAFFAKGERYVKKERYSDAIVAFLDSSRIYRRLWGTDYAAFLRANDTINIIVQTGTFEECVRASRINFAHLKPRDDSDDLSRAIYARLADRIKQIGSLDKIEIVNGKPVLERGNLIVDEKGRIFWVRDIDETYIMISPLEFSNMDLKQIMPIMNFAGQFSNASILRSVPIRAKENIGDEEAKRLARELREWAEGSGIVEAGKTAALVRPASQAAAVPTKNINESVSQSVASPLDDSRKSASGVQSPEENARWAQKMVEMEVARLQDAAVLPSAQVREEAQKFLEAFNTGFDSGVYATISRLRKESAERTPVNTINPDANQARLFDLAEVMRWEYVRQTVAAGQLRPSASGTQDEADKELAAMIALAGSEEIVSQIPTHPSERFLLLMTEQFFANGELVAHRAKYGDRFDVDNVSGMSDDQFIANVLAKAKGKEAKTVVLVSNDLPLPQLEKLTNAGIRFVRTNTAELLQARVNKDPYREKFQLDTYVMMLLMRRIDKDITPDSSLYRVLSFYLRSHFALSDSMAVSDYINAIVNNDIARLIKGYLTYRQITPYDAKAEYENVAKALISA